MHITPSKFSQEIMRIRVNVPTDNKYINIHVCDAYDSLRSSMQKGI